MPGNGGEDDGHGLIDHLEAVGRLAGEFAEPFATAEISRLAGLWHDLGKYRPGFQEYVRSPLGAEAHIEGRVPSRDKTHSTAGALHAIECFGHVGRTLAYLIAGHHGGLRDWAGGLDARLSSANADARREYDEARAAAPDELLALDAAPDLKKVPGGSSGCALWLRMLFSCLVDADFLDTESFMDEGKAQARNGFATLAELAAHFDAHMETLKVGAGGTADTPVNRLRAEVLAQCRNCAAEPSGLFSLTVPTGGGKTLSSLAFALEHARIHGKRRIVYAIPYTSIVEQTADVFARIFGTENVVEHHSQAEADDKDETARSRRACENWDAPLVVTTNVQLFESLFAAKTSRCRKLHNLADSVIVLDEAQCLPPEFLQPILDVLNLLTRHYGVSVVLCTATQPALTSRSYFDAAKNRRGLDAVREIVADPPELYRRLKRVEVRLPDWDKRSSWEEIAAELAGEDCVLAIVNTRGDARKLWQLLPKDTLHLSALMCGAHRAEVIAEIKQRLKDKREGRDDRPLRVVSTSLVEAGVDVSFPVVYRAFAGLDSIAQAAGRCNREGEQEHGRVVVFLPQQQAPPGHQRLAADACRDVLRNSDGDPLALELFEPYFDRLYFGIDLDKKGIVRDLTPGRGLEIQFRTAADNFRLIDDEDQATVFVRYAGYPGIDALLGKLETGGSERRLMRKLQRCAVTVKKRIVDRMAMTGDVLEVQPGCFVQQSSSLYDPVLGLRDDENAVLPAPTLVI
ncbi:MAG: CRISPR-associated helicase Cas3' [Sulfuritalea sp.]|nr:CRISPR-associated helicase Cas3' [Sulfuritalea sp.]